MQILAIETSCDETAASVIKKTQNNVSILSNIVASQINLHKKYGGIFPEHASRAHVEKIIPVVEEALVKRQSNQLSVIGMKSNTDNLITDNSLLSTIDCIAVTTGPGLIGSLLVGVNFAKTYAFANKLPVVAVNHLLGHIYSNWAKKPYPQFPALILIASGGHTGLVLMKLHKDIQPFGETLDDAVGEAFDKVAKLLGLGYPGGPAIAAAASLSNPIPPYPSFSLPRPMLNSGDHNFSFSGLKTAVLYKLKELDLTSQSPNQVRVLRLAMAAEFQQAVIDILIGKTIQAAYQYQPKSICLCGGVSANKELRKQFKKAVSGLPWHPSFHVPAIHLSTDNAAMIGIAASYHLDNATKWSKIHANANLKL